MRQRGIPKSFMYVGELQRGDKQRISRSYHLIGPSCSGGKCLAIAGFDATVLDFVEPRLLRANSAAISSASSGMSFRLSYCIRLK